MARNGEINLGKNVSKAVEKKFSLVKDPRTNKKIFSIGRKIAEFCDRKEIHYYFYVIDEEERKITNLESLRDSEIEKKKKEMEELEKETLTITNKIERLIDQKRDRSSTLEEATIP